MSKRIVPVRWQLLEKIFLAAGFSFARQEGSHRSYVRAGKDHGQKGTDRRYRLGNLPWIFGSRRTVMKK